MNHEEFTPTVTKLQRERGFWLDEQPIVKGLLNKTLSEEQLREWVTQFFVTVTRILRLAHARPKLPKELFDEQMKKYMWENRVEEEYGALSNTAGHMELMLRLCEKLGMTRLQMANAQPNAETRALLDYVAQICRNEPVVSSQIMLGFVEGMMPDACARIVEGLQKNYGMSDEDVRFFSVHVYADEEHGEIARKMVSLVPKEDLDRVADIVLEYTRRFISMWSSPLLKKAA
jgi:pyrroloquinoline-quinone synthase